jgi:hypothetical protein
MNLYRKVLAVQSGGRVLDASNDLVSQINSCVQEATAFYTVSFDPPHADHADEYHDLKVEVDKPNLTARTNTGYYDQPYYSDQPNLSSRRVTVEQLEQAVSAARGESDRELVRQLAGLELTERLSGTKLSAWAAGLHSEKAQRALAALASASAFLDPPPADIAADAPPDLIVQRRIISLASAYLTETIPKLPNFFAMRTTVRYEETPQYSEGTTKIDYQPLHVVDSSKVTVLYRNGQEVAAPGATKHTVQKAEDRYLVTYGTFGPLLGAAIDAIAVPGGLTWVRWEHGGRASCGISLCSPSREVTLSSRRLLPSRRRR